jgi:hypothetical protein
MRFLSNYRFFLALGISLVLFFGTLAAFLDGVKPLPEKQVLEKELLLKMHQPIRP